MRPKSKMPKKQRNYQFNISKHEAHKVMSAPLSPELRTQKGFRSLPIRVGDTVTIVRGNMKGRSGKVTRVKPGVQRVFVDKVVKRKTDNTEIPFPIHPSNLVITKYEEKDRRRLEIINRRIKIESEKLDIDAILAEVDEEDDVIDLEDSDLDDLDLEDDLDDLDLDDDLELAETADDVADETDSEDKKENEGDDE